MILVHIRVLILVLRYELLSSSLVVSDVEVIELEIILVLVASSDVVVELLIDYLFLVVGWEDAVDARVLNLECLETKSVTPVAIEFTNLLLRVEMWLRKLLTPKWSMAQVDVLGERNGVVVLYYLLVVEVSAKGPDIIFVDTVVDEDAVGVWWVSEWRLSA